MQTAAQDRDDCPVDTVCPNPPADDTGVYDLADLWRDLGGSD